MNSQTPISLRKATEITTARSQWETLTRTANAAFAAGDLAQADTLYGAALDLAETFFKDTGCEASAVGALYNISCHNLAETAHRRGDCRAAGAHYRRAFDRLLQAAHAADTPLALRANCVTHLKHATIALVDYLQACGTPAQVADVIATARKASERASRAARHSGRTPNPERH